jgi:hypothetical protein
MKQTIIVEIQQPMKIHFSDLKNKQMYLKDLITDE